MMTLTEKIGNVLFVDDELNILKSIRRTFLQAEFKVFIASNVNEAFSILENETIDLVVSDIKMPDMNGIDFLSIVQEKYPRVVRTVLSGFVDKALVIKAFNNGVANTYFAKPWEEKNLNEGITRILKVRNHLKNKDLLELLSIISSMPVIPKIYSEFMSAVRDNADFEVLEEIISKDLMVTTTILHIANSIFYSGEKTASLKNAILRLGINAVKDLIITMSLSHNVHMDEFQQQQVLGIFKHSALVNKYFQKLHLILYHSNVDNNISSIGITHDLGKILMIIHLPERYKKIVDNQHQKKLVDFYESEIDLGYDNCTHADIGAYLLDLWNFHRLSIETALFHHIVESDSIEISEITKHVFFVNHLVNTLEKNPETDFNDVNLENNKVFQPDVGKSIFENMKSDLKNF